MSDTKTPHGLLLIDKPKGMTSHDVVARVRKILQTRSVGHTGTLDPLASGLMVILVERPQNFLITLEMDVRAMMSVYNWE